MAAIVIVVITAVMTMTELIDLVPCQCSQLKPLSFELVELVAIVVAVMPLAFTNCFEGPVVLIVPSFDLTYCFPISITTLDLSSINSFIIVEIDSYTVAVMVSLKFTSYFEQAPSLINPIKRILKACKTRNWAQMLIAQSCFWKSSFALMIILTWMTSL